MKIEYTCEVCGKKYVTAKEAKECEKKHKNISTLSYYTCYVSIIEKVVKIKEQKRDSLIGRAKLRFGELCLKQVGSNLFYFNIKKIRK